MTRSEQGSQGRLRPKEIDPDAFKVVRKLLASGHEAYLVGGCVRDLYLGRRPKDFDVATSATPEEIRRLFRNSRIIGRRFKLAHIYFGSKIIETSTFRTAPAATGGDEDPLIVQDNEWGSVEDDARRRDFTVNGLFYDIESERIVDFVDGMDDLDAGVIRTIGDPVTRFQEDPVRMIRAIKFAARLDFIIERETYEGLLEVAPDITKCSRARVLEEIYKLLRSGSSKRSVELMHETKLLEYVWPAYVEQFADSGGLRLTSAEADPEEPGQILWRYLAALDAYTKETRQVASNGVLQAALFAPLVGDEMSTGNRQELDARIEELMKPACVALGVAKRDRELARQIIMAHRRMVQPNRKRRRASIAQRQYFHDALVFLGIAVSARGGDESELAHWQTLAARRPKSEGSTKGGRRRRKRGGRRRRGSSGGKSGGQRSSPARAGGDP